MFWVTTPTLRPAASIAAIARWPAFGRAPAAKNSRRIAQDRARTSADSTYRSKVICLGS